MSTKLAPPTERSYEHTSLDLLVKQINEHTKNEGYAVTRKRSKQFKLEILMKAHLCCESTAVPACTGIFNETMRLPCAHKIQERWYDRASGGVLKLENFHPHWRYTKPSEQEYTEEIEVPETAPPTSRRLSADILRVQEPAV
ncbi:MAG: hypothetical protein Q9191_008517, partial [Dirinaria sp. TL-2023a]